MNQTSASGLQGSCSLPSFMYAEFSFEVVKNVWKGIPWQSSG